MTLDHPGLARPLAFGAEGDIPYIVYSDLAGTSMDAVVRQRGPRPVAEVLERTRQLAAAIEFAANVGVLHGMMAPCDVILDGERTAITGFGLAQALIKAGIPAEAGSPYGSPQRLAGALPTRADDIYSLAAITLEFLIGTPKDPDDASRALREAQSHPERRRLPRPAPHETRVFTALAGVDAGKLRAAFAAAFSDEPGERPSTAADFVASLEDAVSNRRGIDEPAPSVVAVPFVSEEPEDALSEQVFVEKRADLSLVQKRAAHASVEKRTDQVFAEKRAEDAASLELPFRQERVVAEKRETPAVSQLLIRNSHPHEPRERKHVGRLFGVDPIDEDEFLSEVTPSPRASSPPPSSADEASHGSPVQSGSRALLVAAIVSVSLGAGFGGGFIVGQLSRTSTESMEVSHREPVAAPQPARAPVEDPKPIVSTQTVVPLSEGKTVNPNPEPSTTPVANQSAEPVVVESGRLLVRSAPAGAGVVVDGESRGVTPLELRELAFGAHTIEVSHPGHSTAKQRVTLSERRRVRSVDVVLRPTSVPADATAVKSSTGSLQVASRPSGAQVFVDDNLIGTTPLLLSNVETGARHLRIELSGYKIWTTLVRIEPSERFRVAASLEP